LLHHLENESGFTGSCLTNDVLVKKPVMLTYAKQFRWWSPSRICQSSNDIPDGFHLLMMAKIHSNSRVPDMQKSDKVGILF